MKFILFTILFSFSFLSYGQVPTDNISTPNNPSVSDGATGVVSETDLARLKEQAQGQLGAPNSKKAFVQEGAEVEKLVAQDSIIKEKKKLLDGKQKKEDSLRIEKEKLRTYGHSFFDNGNLKVFQSAGHIKAPDNYILGVGDELNITIWGNSEYQGVYTINSSGSIEAKIVGRVYLRGMSFGEAKKIISSRFGRVYDLKNSEISIELNYSKVIRVNIVGEVKNPGTYSVSSINSAFNVLAISGGLTDIATVRNIIVKRNNNKIKVLDVYKFLQNPSPENDFYLEDNDYILVNPTENTVNIKGEVKRPGYYELKEKEGIKELIQYAGGFSKKAIKTKARLERYIGDKLVFKDIDLDSVIKEKLIVSLKDGDSVQIIQNTSALRNFVVVKGAVNVPGSYEFKEGEKVLDLLNKAYGVRYDTYFGRAYLTRTHVDNTKEYITLNLNEIIKNPGSPLNYPLKEFDEIVVYSQKGFSDTLFVEIKGAVRRPIRVAYSEDLTVQDLVFMAGGLKREAANGRIEISRISNFSKEDSDEPTRVTIETVAISNELELGKEAPIKLQPHDIIFVRTTPDYHMQKNIFLTGEVKYPGTYSLISKTEKITSVIERAGGVTEWSFLEGATLLRFNEKGDSTIVILDLKALLNKKRKEFDYVLQEGDKLDIPTVRNLVTIMGAVKYPKVDSLNSVYAPFVTGRSARHYIKAYGGGFSSEAKRSSTYIESAGGFVKRTKDFGLFKIYPIVNVGDKVVVIYKEKKIKGQETPIDWNALISRTLTQLTGVTSLAMSTIAVVKLTQIK